MMAAGDRASWRTREGWLCAAAAVLAPALLFGILFLDLFPLVEFRDWVAGAPTWASLADHLEHALLRDRLFDRDLAMVYVDLAALLGGTDIRALNALLLVPFAAACLVLYRLARRIGLPPCAGTAAAWLFAFSLPALDALSWQATCCDRLAALFSLLALDAALAFQLGPWSWRSLAGGNLLVLLWVFGALNSKLSALFLAPALALAPWLPPDSSLRERLARLGLLAAPLAYAAFHLLRYFALLASDPATAAHVLGRSPGEVAYLAKLGQLLGFPPGREQTVVVLLAAALALLLLAPRLRPLIRGTANEPATLRSRAVPWLAFGLLAATGCTLFTRYASPYNQYLPRALLSLLAALGVVRAVESLAPGRPRRTGFAVAVLVAFAIVPFLRFGLPKALRLGATSRNFTAAFGPIRAHVDPAADEPLEIDLFGPPQRVYKFYTGSRRGLLRFIFGDPAVAHLPWTEPVAALADLGAAGGRPPRGPRGYQLWFDSELRLLAIERDGESIYAGPAERPGTR